MYTIKKTKRSKYCFLEHPHHRPYRGKRTTTEKVSDEGKQLA